MSEGLDGQDKGTGYSAESQLNGWRGLPTDKHHGTPRIDDVLVEGIDRDFLPWIEEVETEGEAGVNHPVPPFSVIGLWEPDVAQSVVGIENNEEEVVAGFAFFLRAIEATTQGLQVWIVPRWAVQIGTEPGYVRDFIAIAIQTEEELASTKDGMAISESDGLANELNEVVVLATAIPIEPAYVVILAVTVIIAQLSTEEFVTSEKHGSAQGE